MDKEDKCEGFTTFVKVNDLDVLRDKYPSIELCVSWVLQKDGKEVIHCYTNPGSMVRTLIGLLINADDSYVVTKSERDVRDNSWVEIDGVEHMINVKDKGITINTSTSSKPRHEKRVQKVTKILADSGLLEDVVCRVTISRSC